MILLNILDSTDKLAIGVVSEKDLSARDFDKGRINALFYRLGNSES